MTPNARVQGAATASVAPLLRLPWNAMFGVSQWPELIRSRTYRRTELPLR